MPSGLQANQLHEADIVFRSWQSFIQSRNSPRFM